MLSLFQRLEADYLCCSTRCSASLGSGAVSAWWRAKSNSNWPSRLSPPMDVRGSASAPAAGSVNGSWPSQDVRSSASSGDACGSCTGAGPNGSSPNGIPSVDVDTVEVLSNLAALGGASSAPAACAGSWNGSSAPSVLRFPLGTRTSCALPPLPSWTRRAPSALTGVMTCGAESTYERLPECVEPIVFTVAADSGRSDRAYAPAPTACTGSIDMNPYVGCSSTTAGRLRAATTARRPAAYREDAG